MYLIGKIEMGCDTRSYKWLAVDSNGNEFAYTKEPERGAVDNSTPVGGVCGSSTDFYVTEGGFAKLKAGTIKEILGYDMTNDDDAKYIGDLS